MVKTKKSPTPSTAKKTSAEPRMETPKGPGPSVAPPLEARVAALETVVTRLALAMNDLLCDRSEEARSTYEKNRFYDLTDPLNETIREAAFEEWQEA